MTEHTSNDNHAPGTRRPGSGPDAHGQAAVLLAESLLHGLIARSVITVADAIEIVGIASEVKQEVAADLGDSPATMEKSLAILSAISLSLTNDQPGSDG